jgi:hypothetical protein
MTLPVRPKRPCVPIVGRQRAIMHRERCDTRHAVANWRRLYCERDSAGAETFSPPSHNAVATTGPVPSTGARLPRYVDCSIESGVLTPNHVIAALGSSPSLKERSCRVHRLWATSGIGGL